MIESVEVVQLMLVTYSFMEEKLHDHLFFLPQFFLSLVKGVSLTIQMIFVVITYWELVGENVEL
jgi:hypothetical protein